MAFTVYAQADIVTARLTLEPRSSAGALETTILEAIAAGADTPHTLSDILGLAPRLVLQVLGDLWRAGRITIDLGSEHETLELTTSGHFALHGGDTIDGQAKTTAATSTTEDLIVERVTGRALPVGAASRVPHEDRDLIVPALPDDRQPSDVTSSELVAALAATLQRNGGDDDLRGDQRVTAAFLQPDLLRVASRRRYVELRAAAQVSDTGEVTISVLDDKLTLSERALATARLQKVIDDHPSSHFTSRVRERASHTPLESRGVEQSVTELNRAISVLESAAPNQRQQCHDRAAAAVTTIAAYAQTLTSREMDVRLVHTSDDHADVIHELFRSAEHQLVLAVPWIRQIGLEPFGASLRAALDRGVQVVLLWGIDGHENGLGDGEADWLDSVTAYVNNSGAPGKLLYSRKRAARSHAKLVIADDRHMLVTSKNFLSRSNHFEAGVLLSAIGNRSSPAIEAALRYVYDKAPEPRLAFGLHRLPGAFGPRDQLDELDLKLPRLTKSLLDETATEASVLAWSTAWRDTAARTVRLLDRPHPVVDAVADLRHRGALRHAVTEPKARILLTSDKVTDTALTEDIADQVARRVADGLRVHIRYRQAAGTENRGLTQLHDLAQTTSLDLQRSAYMHAKVVLHDDTLLVGSFNPLSVDADLRHSRAAGEFGVEIRSVAVTNSIWTLLGGPAEGLSDVTASPTDLVPPADSDLAQELLEALESPDADMLKAMVSTHGLSRLLTVLNDFDLDDLDLIRVGGAALATASDDRALAAAAEALLQPLIAAGNWGVARTLRGLLPEHSRPRSTFLDALHDGARTAMSLLTATTSDARPDPEEADALTIVDCVALLLQDDPYRDGDPSVSMSTVKPAARSADFVESVIAHSRNYGPLPPISPHRLGAGGDLPSLWATAQAALATFEHYDSQSAKGDAFLEVLFGPDGEMTRLGAALSARDQPAVLDWDATATKSTDAKWLDKSTQRAGIGRIADSRRRTFLNLRRRLRGEVANLCSAVQLQLGQPAGQQLPAEQLDLIDRLIREAEALHREVSAGTSSVSAVVSAETARLLAWDAGTEEDGPVRDWHEWPFVYTFQALADSPVAIHAPLAAIGTDLARATDGETAVRELARIGEFDRAASVIEQLGFDDAEGSDLQLYVARRRTDAQAMLDEQLQSLSLACQRAGLPFEASTRTIEVTGRQAETGARLAELTADLEASIEQRRAVVADLYEQHRRHMDTTEWAEYVATLIDDGELELAERALHQPDGIRQTPMPRPFKSWVWRDRSLIRVAGWLSSGEPGPVGVQDFIPAPDDTAGQSVVRALVALAEENPAAPTMWIDAIQQMVHSDDDYPRARAEVIDGITTTTFQLPYDHQRLPRLRWVGKDPMRVAVGAQPVPDCSIRFSLDVSADEPPDVAIDVADVLSLLTRRNSTSSPTTAERALQFTAMVCSRLDLNEVIDPLDMPTGATVHDRHRLAWLLTILGLAAEGRDIDRLIVWSGGHAGVMWSLVSAARKDPIGGISSLVTVPSLDDVLVEGVEIDLDRDEDLLVLALGQTSLLLVEGCTETQLAALLEDEWRRANRPIDHRVRIAEVVERLLQKGYVTLTADGIIRSCVCRAVLALDRKATQHWFARQMDLLDPVTRMRDREYEFVLEMVRHQEQAEQALDRDELHRRTSVLLQDRLSDTSPFDLVELCADVLRNYRLKKVDILHELYDEPLKVADVGPSLWVECLVSELLNNAVAATAELAEGEPTVWLTVAPDPEHHENAVLEVRNNGRPMPQDVREAFLAGRRLRRPRRDDDLPGLQKEDRGLGLYVFRTYGELRGVTYSVSEDEAGMTVVTCRIPRGADGTSLGEEPATE